MILKKVGSRDFIVNLLADFILEKLGETDSTQIKVIDVENFLIIKGITSSKEILNLSNVTSEFEKKYSEILEGRKVSKTIDLIKYDFSLVDCTHLTKTFFNTTNCSYNHHQIDDFKKKNQTFDYDFISKEISEENLFYVSEFPHGYSLNQGRLLFYFMKKIFYSLPSNYPFTSLTMTLDTNSEEFIDVFDNFSQCKDEVLKSAILDCVNLNLEKFKSKISKIDYESELLKPLEELEFLLDEKFSIIII